MKTDELEISRSAQTAADALDKVELIALYAGMSRSGASSMRLLAEELLTAAKSIINNYDSRLWMETEDGSFSLHLRIAKPTGKEDRDKLMALSKAGKVTPQRGLFSRLSAAVEDALLDAAQADMGAYGDYIMFPGAIEGAEIIYTYRYMPQNVRQAAQSDAADELAGVEKLIIDSIVDDIMAFSRSGYVEIAAIKKLKTAER